MIGRAAGSGKEEMPCYYNMTEGQDPDSADATRFKSYGTPSLIVESICQDK
jgi:hypothetical protein